MRRQRKTQRQRLCQRSLPRNPLLRELGLVLAFAFVVFVLTTLVLTHIRQAPEADEASALIFSRPRGARNQLAGSQASRGHRVALNILVVAARYPTGASGADLRLRGMLEQLHTPDRHLRHRRSKSGAAEEDHNAPKRSVQVTLFLLTGGSTNSDDMPPECRCCKACIACPFRTIDTASISYFEEWYNSNSHAFGAVVVHVPGWSSHGLELARSAQQVVLESRAGSQQPGNALLTSAVLIAVSDDLHWLRKCLAFDDEIACRGGELASRLNADEVSAVSDSEDDSRLRQARAGVHQSSSRLDELSQWTARERQHQSANAKKTLRLGSRHMAEVEMAAHMRNVERQVYEQADVVLVITDEDNARLQAFVPSVADKVRTHLMDITWMVDDEQHAGPSTADGRSTTSNAVATKARKNHAAFFGTNNAQNRAAVQWYCEFVVPALLLIETQQQQQQQQQHQSPGKGPLPDNTAGAIVLDVAGRVCDDAEVRKTCKHAMDSGSVVMHGFIADENSIWRTAEVLVSPAPDTTGVSTKVLAAMWRGVPVVARPSALQGLAQLLSAPCTYEMSWGGGERKCEDMRAMGVWVSDTGAEMAQAIMGVLIVMDEHSHHHRWSSEVGVTERVDLFRAGHSKRELLKHKRRACLCGGPGNGPRETMLDIIKQTRRARIASRRHKQT
jgi:hypothetical protein